MKQYRLPLLRLRSFRVPAVSASRFVVVALLIGLAIQTARLAWTMVAPIGPVGDWQPARIASGATLSADARAFDPFFRLVNAAPTTAVVTSLALKLFGTRIDYAMGRGSAIIATPDGVQSSFAVGEQIVPGVTLKQVTFDSVTIDRSGIAEQLFLDQSVAAPVASPSGTSTSQAPSGVPGPSAAGLQNAIEASPRMTGANVTGLLLTPKGDGAIFASAGLQSGDVLTAINGKPVTSVADLAATPTGGGSVALQIERGGRTITVSAKTTS